MRRVAVVIALALTAACGGSGEDGVAVPTTTTAAPTTTTTAAVAVSSTVTVPDPSVPSPVRITGTAPIPMRTLGDPVALARSIEAAEAVLRDANAPEADVAAAGAEQQRAYREIAADGRLLDPVLGKIRDDLRVSVRENVTAGQELRSLTKPKSSLPEWRIVDPAPASELESYYRLAESRTGVPWAYLAAVHLVETRMGRIRGTSDAGARGPMQFLPSTWAAYGEGGDIESTRDSILAAGRYLDRNGAPERMADALYAYNHSDRYVRAVTIYAREMQSRASAFRGYYHWQVWYRLASGDVLLPVGYAG